MKMILQENMRYASLITRALDFCEVCLTHTTSLYPFALVSINNTTQSIFVEDECELSSSKMIEELETLIKQKIGQPETSIGLLVYAVTVMTPENQQSDAVMMSISDSTGANTMTIYPYQRNQGKIVIGTPYTCDFSNY